MSADAAAPTPSPEDSLVKYFTYCVTFVTCEVRVCGLRCRSGSSFYIYRVYLLTYLLTYCTKKKKKEFFSSYCTRSVRSVPRFPNGRSPQPEFRVPSVKWESPAAVGGLPRLSHPQASIKQARPPRQPVGRHWAPLVRPSALFQTRAPLFSVTVNRRLPG